MKKILSILLAVAMTAFVGCAGTTPKDTENTPSEPIKTQTSEKEITYSVDPDKKAILVVSFGTSYNDTREKTIGAIEKKITDNFKDYEVRRAFTSQMIIDKLLKRDGEKINNVEEAVKGLLEDGYGTVICQPTHVMNGEEYNQMVEEVNKYANNFSSLKFGTPLLTSNDDYEALINALTTEMPELSKDEALVFMGHGTKHFANATYAALDYRIKDMGLNNIFIGTVESYPSVDTVLKKVKDFGAKKVTLMPLMIVAGDHANNDMAGDKEGSWKTIFKSNGYEVTTILKGLGENKSIQDLFVEHVKQAINE